MNQLYGNVDQVTVPGVSALGPLETRVMEAIWKASGPVSASDIQKQFVLEELAGGSAAQAYTTVKTTLTRLVEKGLLDIIREPGNQAHVYTARQTRDQYVQRIVDQVISQLVDVDAGAVASAVQKHTLPAAA